MNYSSAKPGCTWVKIYSGDDPIYPVIPSQRSVKSKITSQLKLQHPKLSIPVQKQLICTNIYGAWVHCHSRFDTTVPPTNRPRGYKTFFILNSAEHEILNVHKDKNIKKSAFLGSDKPRMVFFPLINVKMPTIVGILTFMSRKNSCSVELSMKKVFITTGPGHTV